MSFLRYRIDLCYVGTSFNGWQSQKDRTGIQDYLEQALAQIFSCHIRTTGASRTDSGVHARHQVATFSIEKSIDPIKLRASLQALLPTSIGVLQVTQVPSNFHPIADAKAKLYSYHLWLSPVRNPFIEPYVWRQPESLGIDAIHQSIDLLVGTHDFSAFCASDSGAKTKERTIFDIKISGNTRHSEHSEESRLDDGFETAPRVTLYFLGNGFLKQMIRSIVGTLVHVGLGKLDSQEVARILTSKDRNQAGPTAPAHGLCLEKIFYDETSEIKLPLPPFP